MATKIYHKDHGYVLTSDPAIIDMILAKGGEIVTKNKEPEVKAELLVDVAQDDGLCVTTYPSSYEPINVKQSVNKRKGK